jgi:enediyne biosynthesis protein E4
VGLRHRHTARGGIPRDRAWVAWIGVALVPVLGSGCGRTTTDSVAGAAVRTPASARAQPQVGPWFVDRAPAYGLDVVTWCGSPEKSSVLDAMGTGVALLDVDGDADLDLFVAPGSRVRDGAIRGAGGPWLFRNDGPGRWTDISDRSGLRYTGWAQGAAVADYDADGDPDLLVLHHGRDRLWQNQGNGTFRDETDRAGIDELSWGYSATWGDADGDGWPDLYVANYLVVDPLHPPRRDDYLPGYPVFQGPVTLPGAPDQLWRNRGDGTFEDVTAAAGLVQPDGKGMGALFVDLDEDGVLDLYVTNDTQPNAWFRGLGGGRFRDQAMPAGLAVNGRGLPEGSMGLDVADVDGDGRLDLAFSNFRHEGTRLYSGRGGGSFEDISGASFVGVNTLQFVGWGLVLADFDDDGWPDLFQANGHVYPTVPDAPYAMPPLFLRNLGNAEFKPVTEAWGPALDGLRSGRGVAVGDLDRDGDLDLVMTTLDGPLRVLINEGRRSNRAINVRLIGNHPNLEALGARVEVEAGGRTRIGVVRRGGSLLAASDVALHFGLGPAASIERITVRWPDGTTEQFPDPPAEAHLTIRQGEGRITAVPFCRTDTTEVSGP